MALLTKSIFRDIFGRTTGSTTGTAEAGLPLRPDIVSLYRQSKVATSGTAYTDVRPGAGDYEAGKGVSLAFSGAQYGKLVDAAGADTSVTLVGDFEILVGLTPTSSTLLYVFIGGAGIAEGLAAYEGTTGRIRIFIDGTLYNFTSFALPLNVPAILRFSRVGSNITLSSGGTEQTLPCKTNDVVIRYVGKYGAGEGFVGNIWDVKITDSTGVKFSNYLSQGGSSGYCESEVGPAVELVGFTLPDAWTESIEYGHVWEDYSEYVAGDEQYSAGHLVTGKVPQSPTNPSQDIFGNALTNPGAGRNNMPITGVTGNWDGVAYGVMGSAVTLVGDFNGVEFAFIFNNSSAVQRIMCTNNVTPFIRIHNGFVSVYVGAAVALFSLLPVFINNQLYVVNLSRTGTNLTCTVGDNTQTIVVATSSLSFNTISSSTVEPLVSPLLYIKLPGHEWLVESSRDSVQPIIYDRIGGNHATLVGATLGAGGFWSVEKDGSLLLEGGFQDDGTSLIPANPNTGLSALGQPLTQLPGKFLGTVALVYAPETKAFYDLAVLCGIEASLYLDGVAIGLTPDEWIALTPTGNLANAIFRSITKDTFLVGWNPALTGVYITRAETLLGI